MQESFIESVTQKQSWAEVLLSVDGIVASGGNTLNQQAIWAAQGIDIVLRQAWDRGIVLGGASAGSLCWFDEGTTDSRPKELSIVKCLGFLKGSHSPHYDQEPGRRPLYHKLIASGEMQPGYACDNDAGLYFEDNTVKRLSPCAKGRTRITSVSTTVRLSRGRYSRSCFRDRQSKPIDESSAPAAPAMAGLFHEQTYCKIFILATKTRPGGR